MEPKTPTTNPQPEMGHTNVDSSLHVDRSPSAAEAQPQSKETHEGAKGPSSAGFTGAPLPALPQLPMPQTPDPAQPSAVQSQLNDSPLAAADEDVIEKEWVDKAKKIVMQTKSDPYAQEKEVSKLQADYLKKRYGKEVKITNDT